MRILKSEQEMKLVCESVFHLRETTTKLDQTHVVRRKLTAVRIK